MAAFWTFFATVGPWLWWAFGCILGLGMLVSDKLWWWRYYQNEVAGASGQYRITRSVLFLAALVPLVIFVITSSGSLVGMGLVTGITVGLAAEVVAGRREPDFEQKYFQGYKGKLSQQERQLVIAFLIGLAGVSVLFSLSALW